MDSNCCEINWLVDALLKIPISSLTNSHFSCEMTELMPPKKSTAFLMSLGWIILPNRCRYEDNWTECPICGWCIWVRQFLRSFNRTRSNSCSSMTGSSKGWILDWLFCNWFAIKLMGFFYCYILIGRSGSVCQFIVCLWRCVKLKLKVKLKAKKIKINLK